MKGSKMAKVLKKSEETPRWSDVEGDKVLKLPLKGGSKVETFRLVKRRGSTTMYCNKGREISYDQLVKLFLLLEDYQPEVNEEEEELEFDL